MSIPHLTSNSARLWESDRDPTANEVEIMERGNFWLNTSTNNLFECVVDTVNSLVWNKKTTASDSKSFMPIIQGTTSAGLGTYSTQIGRFQTINDMAFVLINLQWTDHTGTGNLRVSGLPFVPTNVAIQNQIVDLQNVVLPLTSLVPIARTNGNFLDIFTMIAAGVNAAVVLPSSGILRLTASFFL